MILETEDSGIELIYILTEVFIRGFYFHIHINLNLHDDEADTESQADLCQIYLDRKQLGYSVG